MLRSCKEKEEKTMTSLEKIMANIYGSRKGKQRLFIVVDESIALHGSPCMDKTVCNGGPNGSCFTRFEEQ